MTHRISFSVTYLDSLPGVGVKDSEEFVREAIELADKNDSGTITDVSVTLIEFEKVDQCEGPDDCDAHHPCRKHAAEANAGRFTQR